MPDSGHVARKLRQRRVELGLSQEAAAHKIGASLTTYSRWERGLNQPGPMNAQAIARALRIPLEELMPAQEDEPLEPTLIEAFGEIRDNLARLERLVTLSLQLQGVPTLPPDEEVAAAIEEAVAARELVEAPAPSGQPAPPRRRRRAGSTRAPSAS